jgi:sarcosine oxidase subunit gamma
MTLKECACVADVVMRHPVSVGETGWLRLLPCEARFIFRGDAQARLAAGTAIGVALAAVACRATTDGPRAALWLGPDEHLLIAPDPDAATLAADLARALAGHAHSLVDVGHRQLALELRGGHAEWLLAAQCPLPLDLATFPVGMCTRTVFAKSEVVLWRTAPETFRVEVARSFARYVADMLSEIARDTSV